jgi:hypothetical protein
MIHSFQASLALSQTHADADWWDALYRQAFPTIVQTVQMRDDGWAQRGGIDRQLILADGTALKVDEKVRDGDWQDFCLESWSDRDRRKPGWLRKDLTCDFIAYAFIKSQRCYLLPFQLLRRAARNEGSTWYERASYGLSGPKPRSGYHRGALGFGLVWADNRSYVTESIAVPIDVVLDAVRDAMVINWTSEKAA